MKKTLYSSRQLSEKQIREKIIAEFQGKKWTMTVQSIQEKGYSLEHPLFSGTVFAESNTITPESAILKNDRVDVEIGVINKNGDWKFRVVGGERVAHSKNTNCQSNQTSGQTALINTQNNISISQPSTKVRLFFDESGNFSSAGYHVFASLCHVDSDSNKYMSFLTETENFFKTHNKDSKNFHARELSIETKNGFLSQISQKLFEKMSVYMTFVKLNQKSSYDTHSCILVSSVIYIIKELSNQYGQINLEIFLETRGNLNHKILYDIIREQCGSKKINVPTLIIHTLPKGENAVISLADLFSHMYRSDLEKNTEIFKSALSEWNICYYKVNESYPTGKGAKRIYNRLIKGESIITITKVVTQTKIVKQKGDTVIIRDNTPISSISSKILSEFDEKLKQNFFSSENDKILSFKAKSIEMTKINFNDRLYEIEKLIDMCKECNKNRELGLSIIISEFVTFHLEIEFKKFEADTEEISKFEWLYIKNINRWLSAYNHLGDFKAEDNSIKQAEKFVEKYITNTDCWSEIADFYNHISIAYQNIFEFEKAVERIQPYVAYFSNKLPDNPFGTGNVTGRYIGGLFGNYSQSLFFHAHCSFSYKKEEHYFKKNLENAILYSELSEVFFENEEDKERQCIYRAHGYMMQAVLLGDKNALALKEAENELLKKFKFDDLFSDLFNSSEKINSNHLYALSAFLKLIWLSGILGYKHDYKIDQNLIQNSIKTFPFKHPYEQILGYLLLMGMEKTIILELLKNNKWSQNIIKVIVTIFMIQNNWSNDNKNIEKGLKSSLNHLIGKDMMADPWRKYAIIEQIEEMEKPHYKGIGPISVMPYNYV